MSAQFLKLTIKDEGIFLINIDHIVAFEPWDGVDSQEVPDPNEELTRVVITRSERQYIVNHSISQIAKALKKASVMKTQVTFEVETADKDG